MAMALKSADLVYFPIQVALFLRGIRRVSEINTTKFGHKVPPGDQLMH